MHTIRHHILDVRTSRRETAPALQRSVPRLWRDDLEPILAELLDRLGGPEGFIRLDRVEIDLGRVPLDQLENIREHFRERAAEALYRRVSEVNARFPDETPASQRLTPRERAIERVKYFLSTGRLPWWSEARTLRELENDLLDWLNAPGFVPAWLAAALSEKQTVRRRLVLQFSNPALVAVMAALAGDEGRRVASLVATLNLQLSGSGLSPDIRRPSRDELWLALITSLATRAPGQAESLFARTLRTLAVILAVSEPDLVQSLRQLTISQPESPEVRELRLALEKALPARGVSLATEIAATRASAPTVGEPPVTDDQHAVSGKPVSDAIERCDEVDFPTEVESGTMELAEGISIANAGLVLLAPFLPDFLKRLELQPDKRETSERESERRAAGALLLQLLATGRLDSHPECDLPLPKLLCGVALETPIPTAGGFGERESAECESLLRAVIGHWTALKATSPAGLREAFLLRPGLLKRCEDEWLLQVEACPHDVLLSTIPWTYTWVRYSWMSLPLRVEWHNS